MGWRDDILRQSAKLTRKKRKRKARWYERIYTRLLGEGKTRKEAQDFIAGTGKHQRQRVRPKGYWERRRKLQKQRNARKRAILMRTKRNAKKVRNRKKKKAERR